MKYISICSGIEAASAAWHGLGWTPLAFSEIEPFPSAVLAHHYPEVPNLGDMSKYREWPEELLADCELLVGGTPCQAFSVAGLRRSLDDERGNLSLIYVHLFHHINAIRRKHGRSPAIALWENVPGVLSTKDNAFGCFISGLLGVDDTIETQDGKWPKAGFLGSETVRVGYRVLDAQYFGVAQRRRRVFLVAVPCELVSSLGERACPSEILSLRERVLGNPPSRGEARQAVAGNAPAGTPVCGGCGEPFHLDRAMFNQGVNAQYDPQITSDGVAASMVARVPAAVGVSGECAGTLDANYYKGCGSAAFGECEVVAYTPIVTTVNSLNKASCEPISKSLLAGKQHRLNAEMESFVVEPSGHPDPAYAISAGQQGKGGVFGSGRDSQDTFVIVSNVIATNAVGFNWQNGGDYGNANDGLGITEEGTGPLQRRNTPAVAFVKATNPHSTEEAPRFEEAAVAACLNGRDERHDPPKHIVAIQERAICENPNAGPDGVGVREDGVSFTLEARHTPQAIAFTQNSRDEVRQVGGDGQVAGALSAEGGMHQTNYLAFKESQSGCRTGDVHATIDAHKGSRRQEGVVAFAQNQLGEVRTNDEVMGTVNTNQNASGRNTAMVHQAMQVRRLTPTECCRLQGFPDDRCDITFRKKPAADGPKYRALGNSMAVPCMMWLGWRIHKATE